MNKRQKLFMVDLSRKSVDELDHMVAAIAEDNEEMILNSLLLQMNFRFEFSDGLIYEMNTKHELIAVRPDKKYKKLPRVLFLPADIIADYAFASERDEYEEVEELILPRCKSIGEAAFYGLTGLKKVTFSDRIQMIHERAFEGTSLNYAFIPGDNIKFGYQNGFGRLRKLICEKCIFDSIDRMKRTDLYDEYKFEGRSNSKSFQTVCYFAAKEELDDYRSYLLAGAKEYFKSTDKYERIKSFEVMKVYDHGMIYEIDRDYRIHFKRFSEFTQNIRFFCCVADVIDEGALDLAEIGEMRTPYLTEDKNN